LTIDESDTLAEALVSLSVSSELKSAYKVKCYKIIYLFNNRCLKDQEICGTSNNYYLYLIRLLNVLFWLFQESQKMIGPKNSLFYQHFGLRAI